MSNLALPVPLGPVMLDVAGFEVTPEEKELLLHPSVGGVILFARNYHAPEQLAALTASIRGLRTPPLLIATDHEGGRVQRFREGFTRLPPMAALGTAWDQDPEAARATALQLGTVLAFELRAHGIDFSFTPVLDLGYGRSRAIGDRAFHRDPEAVTALASALVHGLADGGMGAVGKHFPGHGYVEADSHVDVPVDSRPIAEIEAADLIPFRRLVSSGLTGIMPAHVIYPEIDEQPAGFSPRWLKQILRTQLGFQGVIFSDDLSMAGAHVAGPIVARGRTALEAGCDMVLVCNDPAAAAALAEGLGRTCPAATLAALARLHGRPAPHGFAQLRRSGPYASALAAVDAWMSGSLPLA